MLASVHNLIIQVRPGLHVPEYYKLSTLVILQFRQINEIAELSVHVWLLALTIDLCTLSLTFDPWSVKSMVKVRLRLSVHCSKTFILTSVSKVTYWQHSTLTPLHKESYMLCTYVIYMNCLICLFFVHCLWCGVWYERCTCDTSLNFYLQFFHGSPP
jgi:hypothetical protein